MCDVAKIIVPDEVVIEALLKDARRFKSKWELHSNEPTRSKPNIIFLKRTLSNVVKTNEDRMRKPKKVEAFEKDIKKISLASNKDKKRHEASCKMSTSSKKSRSRRDLIPRRRSKSGCSKSKYRSPESRSRSSRKASKRKRESLNCKHSSKI